jgi:hypothetical protein
MIYVSGSEIAAANAWSINIDTDSVEIPQFADTYKKRVTGMADWSGSVSAWDDRTVKTLHNAATAQASVALLIYPVRTDLTDYYSGNAIFSLGSEGDTGSAVGITADFVGNDTLAITGWS